MGFWFRRRTKRKSKAKIPKMTGSPFTNIPRWLYERTKRVKTNPLNRSDSTTTKEKKIHVPNLQKTLTTLIDRCNRLIDEVNKIPAIEARMNVLESKHKSDMRKVAAAAATHASGQHAAASGGSGGGSGGMKKGGKIKMEKGGNLTEVMSKKEIKQFIRDELKKINETND